MDKFSELKAAAMAATPGPWKAFIAGDTCAVHTPSDKRCGNVINWPGFDCRHNAANNAAFIAAANPAAPLELLVELEAYKQYAKERDAENESLALTVGRLRVELEAMRGQSNG
ncbi:hypothetical protein AAY84_07610 [Serratia marcescens]|uniref:ead/Ea22-like family protein n=1 Tax=Serratia marcescens TaxID=615 RepID=UPI00062C4094|nr:ead/Ea22-like family protein [Serratia marcescens]KKZ19044.1 hypothetical protein AAY84_07610 [Serratia marcescens]